MERTVRTIRIRHEDIGEELTDAEAMAALAGETFPIRERVPEAAGEALDWLSWYAAWRAARGLTAGDAGPTHLKLEAADGFEAIVPWEQLSGAAVVFAMDGGPLAKNGPLRFYVPNGTSKCLNVKQVIGISIERDRNFRGEASYGFKTTFQPEELRKGV
ncbi:hypothetical protein IJ21_14680 [Paenibacillus sp. 32O-W]|uniref:hypothetical protein n=1 Tax=Paenibacillus sp. 32O-W TaxID=1695218 RepID=UPI00071F7682|nr:hypothetical protein [Paenibacillus sp. 32O-W]ALS26872.1 hypothetical protein IJ21_14680 [Paenibacillus sp. 32O-W]